MGEVLLAHAKLVLEVLKLYLRQRLGQHIDYFLISSNILELHSSLLYHVSDIMVLELDML
jgi:hypothetical protein